MAKYEMDNGNLLQVPDDKVGKYNLLLGKVVETKREAVVVQGWSHGRDGSLDPTHSVQVLMEIKGCNFTYINFLQMEGQPLEDCLETPDSLPPALPGNIAHLQVSDLWICGFVEVAL